MAASDPTMGVATPTGTLQGVAAFSWDGSAWQPSGRAGPSVATPTGVLQGVAAFNGGPAWQPSGRAQPGVATPTGVLDGVAVYTWSGSAWTPTGGTETPSTPSGALRGVAAFSWDGAAWQPAGRAGPSVATPYGVLDGVAFFNWSGTTWAAGAAVPPGATLDLSFLSGALDPRITFTRASTATYFDVTGTMQTAAINAARFDYDPVTHALRGLLIEEARTNLVQNSGNLAAASWTADGSVSTAPGVTGNQVTAPDGTLTGARIVLPVVSAANAYSRVYSNPFLGSVAQYTYSIWLRGNVGGEQVYLITEGGGPYYSAPRITLTTQWQRYTFTSPALTVGNWYLMLGTDLRDGTQASTTGGTVFAWGAQAELGAFPTTYIPTTAATATRSQDMCSVPSANMGWFVSPGGSWAAEFTQLNPASGNIRVIALPAGGGASPMYSNPTNLLSQYDGVALTTANAITVGAVSKGASTWATGSARLCLNAGAIASAAGLATGYTVFVGTGITLLQNASAAECMSGYIRRVRYWPRVLSDAEMQSITT